MIIALVGGTIGVLFSISLRRIFIVKEKLPYPEGVACAEVLVAGEKGGSQVMPIFAGIAFGAIYKMCSSLMVTVDNSVKQVSIGLWEQGWQGFYTLKGKLDTTPFKKFDDAFNSIDDVSKAHALNETKELLYDLGQRTRFWEATRLIFPFGEAYQEILTTWFKILRDNPAPIRRFQLTVEKGRETNPFEIEDTDRGFFYEDPTTGEEMFAFPGWGGLASKFMGIEGDDPIQLEASGFAASVNLIGQSFLPGFGPLVQVPAAYLTKDVDPESTLVTAIFGDFPPEPTTNPFDYFTRLFPYPSWLKKVIQAYDLDPPPSSQGWVCPRTEACSALRSRCALVSAAAAISSAPAR